MSKSTPLMILTAAALFSGVAGAATRTTVKQTKPVTTVTTTKSTAKPAIVSTSKTVARPATVTTTKTVARPAMTTTKPGPASAARPAPAMKMAATRPAPAGRMVSAKLSNGKTVTYNCSLAGNATKKACK